MLMMIVLKEREGLLKPDLKADSLQVYSFFTAYYQCCFLLLPIEGCDSLQRRNRWRLWQPPEYQTRYEENKTFPVMTTIMVPFVTKGSSCMTSFVMNFQ